jgi:hypothetical protein
MSLKLKEENKIIPSFESLMEHLHPLVRLDRNCANQNIFEQIISTSELIEELVKRELLVFRRYQLDVNDIKCPFQ